MSVYVSQWVCDCACVSERERERERGRERERVDDQGSRVSQVEPSWTCSVGSLSRSLTERPYTHTQTQT